MERVSKHISYKEATKSNTAIKHGIENVPDVNQMINMMLLADNVFEPLREWYHKPIRVNSFFRSEHLNGVIGGSKTSQHCNGQAIDIDTTSSNLVLFNYIKNNLTFDKLIWEFGDDYKPDWIHISYRKDNNRGEVLKAYRDNGKTRYKLYE